MRTIGLLAILICLLAVSCRVEEQDADAVREISLWSRVGHSRDFETQKISAWNVSSGRQAGIRVSYRFYGTDYQDVLQLARAAGNLPDLFKPRVDLTDWVSDQRIAAFDDTPAGTILIDEYRGYLVEGLHLFNGRTFAIPNIASRFRLAINLDLLEDAGYDRLPDSWSDVAEMAEAISKLGDGIHGIALPLDWGENGSAFWKLGLIYGFFHLYGYENWYDRERDMHDFSALAPARRFLERICADESYLLPARSLEND